LTVRDHHLSSARGVSPVLGFKGSVFELALELSPADVGFSLAKADFLGKRSS